MALNDSESKSNTRIEIAKFLLINPWTQVLGSFGVAGHKETGTEQAFNWLLKRFGNFVDLTPIIFLGLAAHSYLNNYPEIADQQLKTALHIAALKPVVPGLIATIARIGG